MFSGKKELEKEVELLKKEVQTLHGFIFSLAERLTRLENKDKVEYFDSKQ